MMLDWNNIALLLDVIHKASAAGPTYSWFAGQASVELLKMQPETGKLTSGEQHTIGRRRSADDNHE